MPDPIESPIERFKEILREVPRDPENLRTALDSALAVARGMKLSRQQIADAMQEVMAE
jgi:hypothetical protein